MSVVRAALEVLLNAIAAAGSADEVSKPGRFIPTWPEAEARYDADRTGFERMLVDYRDEVRGRVNSAVIVALGSDVDSRIGEAVRYFRTHDPALSLPNADVRDLAYRVVLRGTSGANDTREAWKLVDGDGAAVSAAMASRTRAIAALRQLRRLDDVAIRWSAATRAAADCQVPLAEVLALYRVEGNLQVPASTSSIRLGVPTESLTAPTHVYPSPLRTSVSVRRAPDRIERTGPAMHWMLQLAGLDHVSVKLFGDAADRNPDVPTFETLFADNIARWSADNWSAHLPGSSAATLAEARDRWLRLRSLVSAQPAHIDPGTGKRVFGAPPAATPPDDVAIVATVDDPVEFVAGVLAEGVMFLRRLAMPSDVLGGLPAGHALAGERAGTRIYGAFSYNLHMGDAMTRPPYNRPHNAHREAALVSAVIAARRSRHARSKPLSTLIRADATFNARVLRMRAGDDTDLTKANEWPDLRAWLRGDPARFDALVTFIESADRAQWSSWTPFRAHASRYRRLLRFYERVTAS